MELSKKECEIIIEALLFQRNTLAEFHCWITTEHDRQDLNKRIDTIDLLIQYLNNFY